VPFYLKMMGLDGLTHDTLIGVVREVAHPTTDHEVTMLLAVAGRLAETPPDASSGAPGRNP
jgi:hypothetical protein